MSVAATIPLQLDPSEMSDEEISDELFSSPLPQVRVLPDLCRGWQIGNPHGVLVIEMATAACASPTAMVRTGIKPTPLNLALALMGKSAAGKGLAMGVFKPHVPNAAPAPVPAAPTTNGAPVVGGSAAANNPINTLTPGERIHFETPASGEAAVTMFYNLVRDDSGTRPKDVWRRHENPVWSDWAECDDFVAKACLPGSSLEGNVRRGWSGQRLGDSAINRKKANLPQEVLPDTYRWIVSVGAQYKRSASLVGRDSAAGGTVQRLIFAEIEIDRTDFAATMLGREQQRLDARKRALATLNIPIPATDDEVLAMDVPTVQVAGPGDRTIGIEREVQRLFADRRDVEETEVKQHQHLNTLRLAGVHAGWRHAAFGGSDLVTLDDWRFASLIMVLSDRTYEKAVRIVNGEEKSGDIHEGVRLATRQMTAEDIRARKRHLVLMAAVERARKYTGAHPGSARSSVTNAALNATTRAVKISSKELIEVSRDMGAVQVSAGNVYHALHEDGTPVTTPTVLAPLGLVEQAVREHAAVADDAD